MACAGVCSSAAWTQQWRAACLVDEGKTLATRLGGARLPRPSAPPTRLTLPYPTDSSNGQIGRRRHDPSRVLTIFPIPLFRNLVGQA